MHHETLQRLSARYCALVLKDCDGHKGAACRELGITYPTLQRHLEIAREMALVPSSASLPRMKAIA